MFHETEQEFYSWLAGFVDGDGCFSMGLSLDSKGKSMHISFAVTIGLRKDGAVALEYIKDRIKAGRIYWSNKDKENAVIRWQTTNMADSILVTELIMPYLVLKKHKAIKFLVTAKWYQETSSPVYGKRTKQVRTNTEMKQVIKASIDLNYDRQSVRYRNKKGLDYWYPVIDRLYPTEGVLNV